MKTLCIQYTPDEIHTSMAIDEAIAKTESFSSKELKTLIPHLQHLLASTALKVEDVNNICVNTGPAPAFTQRSLLATLNGIAMTLRLLGKNPHLFAIDNFKLLHTLQQQKHPDFYIITIANAYANDLFVLYSKNNEPEFRLINLEACDNWIKTLQHTHKVKIIGTLTDNQEQFFISQGIHVANHITVSHNDYCDAAFSSIQTQQPVDYLFPQYTKLHTAELKNAKKQIITLS